VRARHLARDLAIACGLRLVDQTKLVTAVSELARNTLVHGGGGAMSARVIDDGGQMGVEVIFNDTGPGIPEVDAAMVDGFSTGTGLGLGLGGARRLVHEFTLNSTPGEGTTVQVVRWR